MSRLRRYAAAAAVLGLVSVVHPSTGVTSAEPAATVTWSAPDSVMAGSTTTTSTALYKFSSIVSGKAVRWNPCAPIHYRIRSTYIPSGGTATIRSAISAISAATGIPFVYDGATTATPTSSWLPKTSTGIRPLLIGWTDGSHSDLLRNKPAAVLGVTRTAYFGISVDGATLAATKAAVIALDRTNKLPMTGSVSWKTTILHELGHAMGLDHVTNAKQLMYPVLQRNLYGLQSGDKAGLAKLGRSMGCIDLGF